MDKINEDATQISTNFDGVPQNTPQREQDSVEKLVDALQTIYRLKPEAEIWKNFEDKIPDLWLHAEPKEWRLVGAIIVLARMISGLPDKKADVARPLVRLVLGKEVERHDLTKHALTRAVDQVVSSSKAYIDSWSEFIELIEGESIPLFCELRQQIDHRTRSDQVVCTAINEARLEYEGLEEMHEERVRDLRNLEEQRKELLKRFKLVERYVGSHMTPSNMLEMGLRQNDDNEFIGELTDLVSVIVDRLVSFDDSVGNTDESNNEAWELFDFFAPAADPEAKQAYQPWCFVVDVSRAAAGQGIKALNTFLAEFSDRNPGAEADRLHVAVITAGKSSKLVTDFSAYEPEYKLKKIESGDQCTLGAAIAQALESIEKQKDRYAADNLSWLRPRLVIIANGKSQDDDKLDAASARILDAVGAAELFVTAMPVGNEPNVDALAKIVGRANLIAPSDATNQTEALPCIESDVTLSSA